VIQEVDAALRQLVEEQALEGADVQIVFDAPTKDWASRRTAPTVDLYLYDIREDLRRRATGVLREFDGDDLRARMRPPRHFKLSYLVTAWTQRPEDEHRLLTELLRAFLRHDALPAALLTGSLAELGLPVPITIALPPPEDRAFADVWSALGGELKPSLDLVVCAPAEVGERRPVGPAPSEPLHLTTAGTAGWPAAERRGGAPARPAPEAAPAPEPKPAMRRRRRDASG
jgi:Pvc16 N-terminal domain